MTLPEVTLLYTGSVDGRIAQLNGQTPFSDASWEYYQERAQACGHLIMGRRTAELFCADDSFSSRPFKSLMVLSRSQGGALDPRCTVSRSVAELRARLEQLQCAEVILIGGAETAAALRAARMISRLEVVVEPVLIGSGVPLFAPPAELTRMRLQSLARPRLEFFVAAYVLEYGESPAP